MESILFRIMNVKELHGLEDEIEQMDDPAERLARGKLVEQILEKITDYDVHVREYEYQRSWNSLMSRGIRMNPADRETAVACWDRQFDSKVSDAAKNATEYYTDPFRWHLFSFGLLTATEGSQAQALFNAEEKQALYLFFDYSDEAYSIENAQMLTAADVDELAANSSLDRSDIYFYDPVNKWCYIKPHEACCGPYFFRA